jgi:hypothetical protein
MATLDKEYLLGLRNQALEQRQKYVELTQQANGAIAMVDVLLTELDRQDSPETENQNGNNAI